MNPRILAPSSRHLFWSVAGGLALALSMPPLPLGFLAPVGVACFLMALQSGLVPFRSGLLFGVTFAAPALFWIGWVTVPGTLALILISAALYGLLGVIYLRLRKRYGSTLALLALPPLWLLLELFRGWGEIGFPWLNLAHTQLNYLWLFQFVEFTGDYGLTLWVVIAGIFIYAIATTRRTMWWAILALWICIPTSWGAWRAGHLPPVSETVRVAIVQGDIDTYRKWEEGYVDSSFIIYDSLSRLVAPDAELVVWPETAAPTYLAQHSSHRMWVEGLVADVKTPILLGTLSYERTPDRVYIFNSAYELAPGPVWQGPYSKRQLVPFGEMIPGATWFPWLADIDLGQGNFKPGPGPVVFDSAGKPHAVLICYESAFTHLAREQVLRGARFLVIITNDSWYGRTPGPAQHAAMASLRAAEFRMGVARAANGGISLWTDRAGRRLDATRLFTRDKIICDVPMGGELTFYARRGPWLAWIAGLAGGMFFLMGIWPGRK
jgi:apolipoprotein N-acyltransferase